MSLRLRQKIQKMPRGGSVRGVIITYLNRFAIVTGLTILLSLSVFSQTKREEGIDLYRDGKYDHAAQILQTVVTNDKKDKLAWVYLGGGTAEKRPPK